MRKTRVPKTAITTLIWDIGAPVVVYYPLRAFGLPMLAALAVATGVAALRVAYVAVRHRRFDGVATLMTAIFAAGLAISLSTGDPHVVLLKDSVTTGLIAVTFLGSCLARRPLMYALIRRTLDDGRRAEADARWSGGDPAYRRSLTVITAMWGAVLLAEAAVRVVLVYTLPLDAVFGISHILTFVAIGAALGLTLLYGAHRKRVEAAKPVAHLDTAA